MVQVVHHVGEMGVQFPPQRLFDLQFLRQRQVADVKANMAQVSHHADEAHAPLPPPGKLGCSFCASAKVQGDRVPPMSELLIN